MSIPSCDGKLCFGCPSCAHHPSTIKAIEFAGGREIPVTTPVVCGLIDRIRELEAQAKRTCEATGLTVEDELIALATLLEKGAVRRG